MATVNLNDLPEFRKNSLLMASNINTMIDEMDAVLASSLSDGDKETQVSGLVSKYLPY